MPSALADWITGALFGEPRGGFNFQGKVESANPTVHEHVSTYYAAPSQITTNALSSTMTWSSFLGLSSTTGPNGDGSSIYYDANAQPYQTTSPYGAVTSYAYYDNASPPSKYAFTNTHWSQTIMDGFGRTITMRNGYGGNPMQIVDTTYSPCGCSPLGKMSQTNEAQDYEIR